MPDSESSAPTDNSLTNHLKFINLWQSNEERQGKYWLAKSYGATRNQAMRMRDWRLSKIERCFSLDETYDPRTKKYNRNMSLTLPTASQCSVEA